jgi:hypothetical protein
VASRRTRSVRLGALLAAALQLSTATGQAAPPPSVRRGEAPGKVEYQSAVQLMEDRACEKAVPLLEQAYAKGQFRNALWNLAECYRLLDRPVRAIDALERFRVHPRTPPKEKEQAGRDIASLRAQLPRLEVRSSLPGAQVLVDGHERGKTPIAVELDPGPHIVEVQTTGFSPARRQLTLRSGERTSVELGLTMLPARLTVETQPAGAEIAVGGRPRGRAPITLPLTPGEAQVVATLPGHRDTRRAVTLLPGGDLRMVLTLPPRVAQLAVTASPPGARVSLDGALLGQAPLAPRNLTPGNLTLTVAEGGYQSWTRTLTLRDAESASVTASLYRGRLSPLWVGTAAAITAGTLAGAVVLLQQAGTAEQTFLSNSRMLTNPTTSLGTLARLKAVTPALADQAHTDRAASTALFVVAGAAAAATGVLAYFTRWRRSRGEVNISAVPTSTGLVVTGQKDLP